MNDASQLQGMVKDQLDRHSSTKYKPSILSTTTSSTSLKFSDSSVGTLHSPTSQQPASVLLTFEPTKAYQRSSRVIKHSNDRYVHGTDYAELQSLGSETKSFASNTFRSAMPKFPEYSSLNSRASSSYKKGQSRGKLRKVTLTKLETLTRSYEAKPVYPAGIADSGDSLCLSLSSLQSRSLEDLFASTFLEREETKKELDAERFFTSKVATPRLVQTDPEAHFKSKDLLNAMIEDVSIMSMSTVGTKGQSLGSGSLGTLNEWKTMYNTENVNYDSAALFAEVRYLELKTLERDRGSHPTKLKATVCADLLMKLCASAGRISKVMEPILWELLNCVFIDFPNNEDKLRGPEPLKGLYAMSTYFDKHKEQMELYDDIHNELEMVQQGLKMSEIVKKFQTVKMVFQAGNFYQRDCSFFLWKGEVNRSKHRQRVALRRALLYRWRQWRAYLMQFKAVEFEDMDSELDKKIESLNRLQLLLQAHNSGSNQSSPMHADAPAPAAPASFSPVPRPSSKGKPGSAAAGFGAGVAGLESVSERDEYNTLTASMSTSMRLTSTLPNSAVTGVSTPPSEDTIGFEPDTPVMFSSPVMLSTKSGSFRRPPTMPVGSPDFRIGGSEKKFKRERGALPVVSRTNTAQMDPAELRKLQEQKLSERRNLLEQVDSSIRATLSTLSISSFKGSSGGIQLSQAGTPLAGAATGGAAVMGQQHQLQGFHPNLSVTVHGLSSDDGESAREEAARTPKVTIDLLKEAALLASTFTCPMKEQTTQTPDVWMTNVNEQPFANAVPMALMNRNSSVTRPGIGSLSRQNSGIRGVNSPTISTKQMPPKEEGRIDAGGKNPPNYKLETVQACQLITYIYESKLKAALEDHSEINFYECEPLLEFTKERMLKRYGLKRLADKFFKGLVLCVMKEGIINRRLETFGQLCGLTLEGHKEGQGWDESTCSFYFRALGIIFGANTHLLAECMNAFEVDREIILEVLPDLFPNIEKHNPELSKTIMFEVVDLPRNTPGTELEYKVNFDDLMTLIMDYFEHEHKLDLDDNFLYEPLVEPVMEEVKVVKPQSPEQLKALSALTNFSKKYQTVTAQTPKRVRVMPTQDLV